jgi:hypothetical protein
MKDPLYRGRDLRLELLDPNGAQLVRLFRHDAGDWDPPPVDKRNLRVDPPLGHQAEYAVLYTGNTLSTIAIECRVLNVDAHDRYTYDADRASEYKVVRYAFDSPAIFIPLDGDNRERIGLGGERRPFTAGYGPWREAAHELFKRFGNVTHGLSWESFHRHQPGRVYALWHHHKTTIGLSVQTLAPYKTLQQDEEWIAFLQEHPDVEKLKP